MHQNWKGKIHIIFNWKQNDFIYRKSRRLSQQTLRFKKKSDLIKFACMYGCESWTIKKGWMLKNWCFWTVKLAKTLESPLDCKKIKPVNPKGNQSWIFIGRTDAEAGAPIFWLPDAKTNKQKTSSLEKILMLEKIEGRRRRGWMTEDEMVGRHHLLNEHELSKFQEMVKDREGWHAVYGVTKNQTWLSNWTTTNLLDAKLTQKNK